MIYYINLYDQYWIDKTSQETSLFLICVDSLTPNISCILIYIHETTWLFSDSRLLKLASSEIQVNGWCLLIVVGWIVVSRILGAQHPIVLGVTWTIHVNILFKLTILFFHQWVTVYPHVWSFFASSIQHFIGILWKCWANPPSIHWFMIISPII